MKKSEWIAIAEILRGTRTGVLDAWPPREGYMANAFDTHDRKLIYLAKLEQIDALATVFAAALDRMSTSFNRHQFFRIVNGARADLA